MKKVLSLILVIAMVFQYVSVLSVIAEDELPIDIEFTTNVILTNDDLVWANGGSYKLDDDDYQIYTHIETQFVNAVINGESFERFRINDPSWIYYLFDLGYELVGNYEDRCSIETNQSKENQWEVGKTYSANAVYHLRNIFSGEAVDLSVPFNVCIIEKYNPFDDLQISIDTNIVISEGEEEWYCDFNYLSEDTYFDATVGKEKLSKINKYDL